MMLIHCARDLAVELPEVSAVPLAAGSPLGGWHGQLYRIGRSRCVMLCNDPSRYILFLPGVRKAELARLGAIGRELFLLSLEATGVAPNLIRRAELALGPARFDRCTDRSVQGTLRVARSDLEPQLRRVPRVLEVDAVGASGWLNRRPVSARGQWLRPAEAMVEQLRQL